LGFAQALLHSCAIDCWGGSSFPRKGFYVDAEGLGYSHFREQLADWALWVLEQKMALVQDVFQRPDRISMGEPHKDWREDEGGDSDSTQSRGRTRPFGSRIGRPSNLIVAARDSASISQYAQMALLHVGVAARLDPRLQRMQVFRIHITWRTKGSGILTRPHSS